ncbi:MAG: hypothetical protein V4787_13600 [Pseudomonadota bacterium]
MKYPMTLRIAVLTAALGVGAAFAQQSAPLVMTDTAPLPAEDRNSTGAILLDNSPVRAQRDRDFDPSEPRASKKSVGKGIMRATIREQSKAERAKAREAAAIEFYQRGAGAGTPD